MLARFQRKYHQKYVSEKQYTPEQRLKHSGSAGQSRRLPHMVTEDHPRQQPLPPPAPAAARTRPKSAPLCLPAIRRGRVPCLLPHSGSFSTVLPHTLLRGFVSGLGTYHSVRPGLFSRCLPPFWRARPQHTGEQGTARVKQVTAPCASLKSKADPRQHRLHLTLLSQPYM